MKIVKTKQKYKCDYCRKVAGIVAITNHEPICWRNPKRFCELCKNTGEVGNYEEGYEPCYYCSQFNKDITESLALSGL